MAKNERIEEFYRITLYDLNTGVTVETIKKVRDKYVQHEFYLEAAGITKALDEFTGVKEEN